MKNNLFGSLILTSAVAVACLAGNFSSAQAQPAPPDTAASLPPDIAPDSPLGQVVKLVQAGVELGVIKTYIANAGSAFDLDAEKIVALNDLGVPTELINSMMQHDKILSAAAVPPPPATIPAPAAETVVTTVAAPTAPVTVEYFDNTLSPYGSWVVVEGYGRVWRPTTVIYDSSWQPYCDRGHWVYSDCGWYWDSDYAWGATFHYGRWFHHDRFGWCWWPDTTWAPSWVTWRQSDEYCGWAPLPPFSVYRPGFGFLYRGTSVAIGFDFGLAASCFTFVPVNRFCERHPRYYRTESRRGEELFHRTTVINNFHDDHRTVFNGGISVDRFREATHRPLQPVAVRELPNAGRQGWRGGDADRADHRPGNPGFENGAARNGAGSQTHPGASLRENNNGDANANHRQNFGQPNQPPNRNGNLDAPSLVPRPDQPGNHNGQREGNNHNSNPSTVASQNPAPGLNTRADIGAPFVNNSPSRDNRQSGGMDRNQAQNNRNQQSSTFTPANNLGSQGSLPVNNYHPPTVTTSPENHQSGLVDRSQSLNNRNQQQSQFTPANNVPVRSTPPVDLRQQNRTLDKPVVSAPPRSLAPINQNPVIAVAPVERPIQREQHFEQRQNPVVTAPRYVAPPNPPPNPAPVQNQQHSGSQNSDRNPDKDKPHH